MVRSARNAVIAVVMGSVAFAQGSGSSFLDALRYLFVPQVPLQVRFERVYEDFSDRFPWSVYYSLRDLRLSGEAAPFEWTGSIGPIPLPRDGVASDVLGWIRQGMGVLMGVGLVVWLTNRLAPQLKL